MQFKYSALAVVALSGLAAAQIPSCATTCIANAISSATTCGATDTACQCETANKAAIQAAATPCVESSCTSAEILQVLAATSSLCTAGTSSSSSASVAPSSSSVAPSSSASVATYSTASVATYSTSAPAKSSSASTLTTTASASKTAASNGTTTPTVVPFTGSASSMAAGLGSVFAIGFAVLAAF